MAKYKINTKEHLEKILRQVGIEGEWIMPDDVGFSRVFEFTARGQTYIIRWYYNLSTICCGNMEFWFDYIDNKSNYPLKGKWIELGYRDYKGLLHIRIDEEDMPV